MIQRSAIAVLHDSSHVGLPSLGGINSNGEGTTVGDESLHLGLRVHDVLVAGELGGNLAELAGVTGSSTSHSGGVWVLVLSVDTMVVDNPLEGVVHETTIASHITIVGALDEFFLGEGDEVLGVQEVLSFHVSSGRERPARATLALVLDVGDSTVLSPILGRGSGLDFSCADFQEIEGLVGWHSQVVVALELMSAKISKLVDSEEGAVRGGVKLVIHIEVLLEAFEGMRVFNL